MNRLRKSVHQSFEHEVGHRRTERNANRFKIIAWGLARDVAKHVTLCLCAEHAARTNVVEQRLATMNRYETYAYFDGLIDAQQGMTTTEKDALREHLRAKYADRD